MIRGCGLKFGRQFGPASVGQLIGMNPKFQTQSSRSGEYFAGLLNRKVALFAKDIAKFSPMTFGYLGQHLINEATNILVRLTPVLFWHSMSAQKCRDAIERSLLPNAAE